MPERIPLSYNPIPLVDYKFRDIYEEGLYNTHRWGKEDGETDYNHVYEMLERIHDVFTRYPTLSQWISREESLATAYFHDGGEIKQKDLHHYHPQYKQLHSEWKKKEREAFLELTDDLIPSVKPYVQRLYEDYINKNTVVALFVDFIDKGQGNTHAMRDEYKAQDNSTHKRQKLVDHSIELITTPIRALCALLPPEGNEIMRSLWEQEIATYALYGYEKEITRYTDKKPEELQFTDADLRENTLSFYTLSP